MTDDYTHLHLPMSLCRDVRILAGTALSLKVLLSLEGWRETGEEVVTVPVDRLADHAGSRPENVRKAISKLGGMRAATYDGDTWAAFPLLEPGQAPIVGRGADAEVTVHLSSTWSRACNAERDVALPLVDVRALETRPGLLLRLRAAAALYGRTAKTYPRLRFNTADFPHYTGYDGRGSPNTIVRQLLTPGFRDVNERSSTVELRMKTA